MKINDLIVKNDVEAENQTREKFKVVETPNSRKRVLFLGNSITLHERAPQIGWNHNWGMAASCEENDYVHILLRFLREKYGEIGYCITNVGEWEKNYWDEDVIEKFKGGRDFQADTVIFRVGENIPVDRFEELPLYGFLRKFVEYFTGNAKSVVITDTFWEHGYVCDALKKVAEENGYAFVRLSDLGYENENMALGLFEHKGVAAHPGDLGMKRIAERIEKAL